MKKLLILLLAFLLSVPAMSGCSPKTDEELKESLVPSNVEVVKPSPKPETKPPEAPLLSKEELERKEQEAIYEEAGELEAPEEAAQKERPKKALGYLNIPGTAIDDWVMWASDNQYFLRKDENENYNFYGCYYFDQDCRVNPLSKNMIIYGHNMSDNKNDSKFAQLLHFIDIGFINKNQNIYLKTSEGTLLYKVIAAMYSDINWDYILSNPDSATMIEFIQEYKSRSQCMTDAPFNEKDKYLTLSTCTYKYGSREDQRFIVVARLQRDNESSDTLYTFTANPEPKEPDFDAVKVDHGYASAETPDFNEPENPAPSAASSVVEE